MTLVRPFVYRFLCLASCCSKKNQLEVVFFMLSYFFFCFLRYRLLFGFWCSLAIVVVDVVVAVIIDERCLLFCRRMPGIFRWPMTLVGLGGLGMTSMPDHQTGQSFLRLEEQEGNRERCGKVISSSGILFCHFRSCWTDGIAFRWNNSGKFRRRNCDTIQGSESSRLECALGGPKSRKTFHRVY